MCIYTVKKQKLKKNSNKFLKGAILPNVPKFGVSGVKRYRKN